jgi:hypothetical protein
MSRLDAAMLAILMGLTLALTPKDASAQVPCYFLEGDCTPAPRNVPIPTAGPTRGGPIDQKPQKDFIFADSHRRMLQREEIMQLSPAEKRIARNEIFARKGRIFESDELRTYFSKFSWYRPEVQEIELTATEKYNVALIAQIERGEGPTDPGPTRSIERTIFADAHQRRLSPQELTPLSKSDLRLARNEIWARGGRFFENEDLRKHFEGFAWYKPYSWRPVLNPIARANVELIARVEAQQ